MDIGKEIDKAKVRKLRPGIPAEDQPQREPQERPILVPNWPVREPAPDDRKQPRDAGQARTKERIP